MKTDLDEALLRVEERLQAMLTIAQEQAGIAAKTHAEADRLVQTLSRMLQEQRQERILQMVFSPQATILVGVALFLIYALFR